MKLLLITLAAGAFAAAPPRIELDLSAMMKAEKLEESIYRSHNDGLQQPNGKAVLSRQDWTERCTAGASTTIATCPFPVAKAWDHQDQDISSQIRTRVYLVDVNGHSCGTNAYDCGCASSTDTQCQVQSVDFGRRSTYLFKYDVTDNAGNHAEQVVFALILDDSCGAACNPTIVMCGADAETWQAASSAKLCDTASVTDNIDTAAFMKTRLQYDISELNEANTVVTTLCQNEDYEAYKAYNVAPAGKDVPCATSKLATSKPGRYLVVLHACDNAGVYGANSQNNCHEERKAIVIEDTLVPVIDVHGYEPTYQECHYKDKDHAACQTSEKHHAKECHMYVDEGATVRDKLDTETNGHNISGKCNNGERGCLRTVGHVDSSEPAQYSITYDAWDLAGNQAVTQVRKVIVSDNTAPTATLVGEHRVTHYARTATGQDEVIQDDGATCDDACDRATITPTMSWDREFNDRVLGDYVRTYTCEDNAGHKSSVTRTFTIEDNGNPTITIMGNDRITLAASRTLEYTDQGATCEDYVDGTLSHAVEVSGQVVNMRIPGTYSINYDCQDLSGNGATQKTRVVVIQDNDCPRITMLGDEHVYVEAGFPYTDAGATATDDLDGDITAHITTSGDTVNTQQSFYSRRSCREIKSAYAGAHTGEYYITVYIAATKSFERRLVYCDMDSTTAGSSETPGFTYWKCTGCGAVKPYADKQGDCPAHGLAMAQFGAAEANTKAALLADPAFANFIPDAANANSNTDMYLCSTNDASVANANGHEAQAATIAHDKITRAEQGKYIIFYHVSDSAGNTERSCGGTSPSRTVVVKDTLPPVITLHLANKLIHTGAGGTSSAATGSLDNPADNADANPHLAAGFSPTETAFAQQQGGKWQGRRLLAESTQTGNAWVFAGAAAAVAGVALLALSARKQAVVVEV